MLHAVIMAGGSGTRFWPLSRKRLPKQFLKLFGERSLIQQTADRIQGLVGAGGILVITNEEQVPPTKEQLPDLASSRIVGEPCGRDTAACIALAAALLLKEDPAAHMIVLAADHLIGPLDAFHAAVRAADQVLAEHPEALVTFGIPPTQPATGYGYLRRGAQVTTAQGTAIYKLKSFHEKPDRARAEEFLASGEYYWNSGIFCWQAATILGEIDRNCPALGQAVRRIANAWGTPEQETVFAAEYAALPKISIDYAVMEKSRDVYMVEAPFQWDDVGSWLALDRVLPQDSHRNVVIGNHDGVRTEGCIVVGDSSHRIATLGVRDLIIVHTSDVTLVADRKDEQSVKELIAALQSRGLSAVL